MGAGAFIAFFGFKTRKIVNFILACLLVTIIFFVFIFNYIVPAGSHDAIFWVVLIFSFIFGIGAGILVICYEDIIIGAGLGAVCGFFLAFLCYQLCLGYIPILSEKWVIFVYYIIVIGVCALIGFFIKTGAILLATSLSGSYMICRGITLIFLPNTFPSETDIIKIGQEYDTLSETYKLLWLQLLLFSLCWLFLTAFSLYSQIKMNKIVNFKDYKSEDTQDSFLSEKK